MKIKRELNTKEAKYTLEDIGDTEFNFLYQALRDLVYKTQRCIPDPESKDPIAILYDKFEKMNQSSVTIV